MWVAKLSNLRGLQLMKKVWQTKLKEFGLMDFNFENGL